MLVRYSAKATKSCWCTYQGTLGVFVRFRQDANWADVTERNGTIRGHPVAWLDHFTGAARFTKLPPTKETT